MNAGAVGAVCLLGLSLLAGPGCTTALCHGLATAFRATPSADLWSYEPGNFEARDAGQEPTAEARLLARFAPRFVIEEGEAPWNRIGTPTLHRRAGVEWARVDPARATLFATARAESVGGRALWQLVYRVHFEQLAPTWTAFFSLHRNAGLLVQVTLDRATELPLLVSTVHTCGCWLAVTPTVALAHAALPDGWPAHGSGDGSDRLSVPEGDERFLVHLATRTHRVRALTLARAAPGASQALPLCGMDELHRLPIHGASGETGSFFYAAGYLRGYVKGAFAAIEGLSLGLLTLDPRLGMDRDFGSPEETGARFFTALVPWKREASRLDRLERALEELGFHVRAFRCSEEPGLGPVRAPGAPSPSGAPATAEP